nr:DNA ligase 4 [Tanacetum cinerariifolium]
MSTSTGSTKFSIMVSLFTWIQKSKQSSRKRSKFRKFIDTYCKPSDYFSAVRLILPNLDRERGSYGLKESVLATCIIDALGMSRDSEDAVRLINWRKGGAKTGVNVGNFALVAAEVLQRRQGMISGGLTIKELNDLLDRLASSENRTEKTAVLSELIMKTNAQEMKWIVMIILKDLKLGISEKSIFHEFHPDAEDLFNVTCDLKLVCERLRDRHQRHKRQDIEVGKAVRPQLALRVANAASAWKKLHGKEVVVECKFDGDRIQIHKNGKDIHFFSRTFLDHPEYIHGMSDVIMQNILVDRCILDGEMLVWDTSTDRFADFGSNQEIAKAAREGLASERQLCYVAFDILYDGDTSVIHQSLKERHELLKKVVKPVKGRLEILVPDGGLNVHTPAGEPYWSRVARSVDDVETFFKRTTENRDEGIVLKDLDSKWEPSDRSGKWLKLKPEYVKAGSDLDVLIIGGYYGSGRRGGQVAQFLVGLAERPASNSYPRRFISFCRVGTGLTDEELDAVVNKLKPYFKKYEYPKKGPPSYYKVTNHSKERPDVWIDSPEKSIILSITSDIRTIRSEVFAAPYSLRFPRIDKVRDDKPWHECLDVESFVELVHASNNTTQWGKNRENPQEHKPKRSKTSKTADKKSGSLVPSHLLQTDVSQIKGDSLIFSNMMFYFANVPLSHSLDSMHKMVAENGGTFSMNLNNSVTHCIAAETRGIKFQAAKRHGDVIHYSWLLDCCSQKKLVPLQPKHFLVLSESSKKKLQEDIDEFSDTYYLDIDIKDLEQLLNNIDRSEDAKALDYYKKKYCPLDKWSRFSGCCVYFYIPENHLISDWEALLELTMRRMKLEVSFTGGKVSSSISNTTHFVVMSFPGFHVEFDIILKSFSASDRRLLKKKTLHIVDCRWLEDCFDKDQLLQEEEYSLRPTGLAESTSSDEHALDAENISSMKKEDKNEKGKNVIVEVPTWEKYGLKRRGRPTKTKTSTRGKTGLKQPRRTRARSGNKTGKIHEYISDEDEVSLDDIHHEMKDTIVQDTGPLEQSIYVPPDADITPECGDKRGDHTTDKASDKMGDDATDKVSDKLEVMVDPVQAMLFDMIPSLEPKPTESMILDPPIPKKETPTFDPNPGSSKKKKVSYRDLAMSLLKD